MRKGAFHQSPLLCMGNLPPIAVPGASCLVLIAYEGFLKIPSAFSYCFSPFSGYLLFKDFCENVYESACTQIKFYEAVSFFATSFGRSGDCNLEFTFQIKDYERLETTEERMVKAKEIYDHHMMVEMLAHTHVCSPL